MKLLEKEISIKLIQGETITIIDKLTLLRVEEDLIAIKKKLQYSFKSNKKNVKK